MLAGQEHNARPESSLCASSTDGWARAVRHPERQAKPEPCRRNPVPPPTAPLAPGTETRAGFMLWHPCCWHPWRVHLLGTTPCLLTHRSIPGCTKQSGVCRKSNPRCRVKQSSFFLLLNIQQCLPLPDPKLCGSTHQDTLCPNAVPCSSAGTTWILSVLP